MLLSRLERVPISFFLQLAVNRSDGKREPLLDRLRFAVVKKKNESDAKTEEEVLLKHIELKSNTFCHLSGSSYAHKIFGLCWQKTDRGSGLPSKNFWSNRNNNPMVPGLENMVGVALYPIQALKAFGE
ncbi:hypothetical protein TNCV_4970741 [Trichonephila clavipes]|nr:hypothetical protein TNCV_4970741 [Trichonephila clavipes]